jgi:hypothetical protein
MRCCNPPLTSLLRNCVLDKVVARVISAGAGGGEETT